MTRITLLITLLFSSVLFSQIETISLTSFESPEVISGQYTDLGDPAVAHELLSNADEPIINFTANNEEMGFSASYFPYDSPSNGLTDGDFVGVTNFTSTVGMYTDGANGYQISDTDGTMVVEFDVVDFAGFTNTNISIDYFIAATGYEGDGTENTEESDRMRMYVRDLTNMTEIDIFNSEGTDINDLMVEGAWVTGTALLPDGIEAQLVVEVRVNSGSEALYLDNILAEGEPATTETSELVITEIFAGQEGADLTADWFEITNNGDTAWVSGVDGDLYYDDESASGSEADIITGITEIAPGASAIVLVTGTTDDIATFTNVWGTVIDLTDVQIGTTDGAGLGGGGDTVTLWVGDPLTTTPVNSGTYPDTELNDGQSYDVELAAFSVVGNANGAVETVQGGGDTSDVKNIGSPGNGMAIPLTSDLVITEIFAGQEGADLTADWFEITNNGDTAWVSGVDGDLYYDDESASGSEADIITGITEIAPGTSAIVLVTGTTDDIATFTNVWGTVIDLTDVQIGTTDGAGLGGGGDTVTLWVGDPLTTTPVNSGTYPDTELNDGQSYDVELAAFSVVGNANGAVETIEAGGDNADVTNIGSPGNGLEVNTVAIGFDGAFTSVVENEGSVTVTVQISAAPTTDVMVDVALLSGGSAIEGTDFDYTTSTVIFPQGSTTPQTVTIPIADTADDNSDVFFVVQLQNLADAQLTGTGMYSVYILDDDTVVPEANASELDVNFLSSYLVDANGTAEITAYDASTQRLYVTNATSVEVLDFSDPQNITSLASVDLPPGTSGVQSIAVNNGIVAAAVAADPPTNNGFVVFTDLDGINTTIVEVGSLPDMLTFTPDGSKVLVANEGQPSNDYTIDPEGSVSVIDVSGGLSTISQASVTSLNFNAFDASDASLKAAGVRIYGPNASVSQDMEPEYIAVSDDSSMAYVTLQENNAYAIVDISAMEVTNILPFGLKDHSLPENSLDLNDETDFIFNASWPVKGMFMPDAIAYYETNGTAYILTANEGDAREYDAFEEEVNIGDDGYVLDPSVFNNEDILSLGTNLARIKISSASGDSDGDGMYEEIHIFGGRSFSIFEAETATLVYDSGNDFEVITAADPVYGSIFNASNENNNYKNRSDNKGPEPEGILVQTLGSNTYAFIILERIGGMMIYNITDPINPVFLQYVNNRDAIEGGEEGGDLGPEGILFVTAEESPTGSPLLVVSNEVSATVSVYSIDAEILGVNEFNEMASETFSLYPNPTQGMVFMNKPGDYKIYDSLGRLLQDLKNVASISVSGLASGTYIVQDKNGVSKKLLVE
ncbi:choice-of-anchor I family protein [Cochleicola gelatinilyticus]|uniref:LTD domain-containing protein n=1 Tax=Cochleicola gelatinilyticus TaxID=1763537 RepID=A0A167HHM7_9FLAO|nr:choice-of-anchor I family protein [Cochleicola gelatinilyticus]OAB78614.1 hypothetical protein ULVI_08485 [Cochleicola gelatinilyticus]